MRRARISLSSPPRSSAPHALSHAPRCPGPAPRPPVTFRRWEELGHKLGDVRKLLVGVQHVHGLLHLLQTKQHHQSEQNVHEEVMTRVHTRLISGSLGLMTLGRRTMIRRGRTIIRTWGTHKSRMETSDPCVAVTGPDVAATHHRVHEEIGPAPGFPLNEIWMWTDGSHVKRVRQSDHLRCLEVVDHTSPARATRNRLHLIRLQSTCH